MSTLPRGGAEDSTSTRSSGNGNGAQVLAARFRAARQLCLIAPTRSRLPRWTCTSTWSIEAGLPYLLGLGRTSRAGAVTIAVTSMNDALAKATSEPMKGVQAVGNRAAIGASAHIWTPFKRKNN